MSDTKVNIIYTLRDEVSAGANKIKNELDGLGVKTKGTGGIIDKLGNVTGGLVTPMTAAAAGAFALGAVIVDATKAAADEQAGIAQLNAALKANVPGWDGDTAAIERTIRQREKLAFSDDDLRQSLALLVGSTHDVSQALDIQQTAMDLARFKGISLADASTALIKVEGGQYRALKALGIQIKTGASETEALAAVQKVAGGQAQAYGDTTAGAMESAQIAIHDVFETLGQEFLPIVKDVAIFIRDQVAPALEGFISFLGGVGNVISLLVNGPFKWFFDALGTIFDIVGKVAGAIGDLVAPVQQAGDATHSTTGKMSDDLSAVQHDFTLTGDAAGDMGSGVQTGANKAKDAVRSLVKSLDDSLSSLIKGYFDPIKTHFDFLDQRSTISAAIVAFNAAKESKAHRDAASQINDALSSAADDLQKLGDAGRLTQVDVDAFTKDATAAYKAMGQKVPRDLQGIIDTLNQLASAHADITVNFDTRTRQQAGKVKYRAAGGPVDPGETYIVGEHGPEQLTMGSRGGYVTSHLGGIGSRAANVTVNFNSVWPPSPQHAREVARFLDGELYKLLQRAAPTSMRT